MSINKSNIEHIATHLDISAFLSDVAKLNPTRADVGLLLEEVRIHTRTNPKWTGSPVTRQYLREVWDDIASEADDEEDFAPTPEPKPSTPKKQTKAQETR